MSNPTTEHSTRRAHLNVHILHKETFHSVESRSFRQNFLEVLLLDFCFGSCLFNLDATCATHLLTHKGTLNFCQHQQQFVVQ